MKYIVIIIIVIVLQLILSVFLIIQTCKMVKRGKAKVSTIGLNVFLISLLTLFMCIAGLSASYNYFYEKGANLICQKKYRESIESLEKSLAIRTGTGKLAKLLEKKTFGFPLFFSTEKDVRMAIANSYKSLKDHQNAIKEYQIIISLDNNNYDAIAGMAESFFLMRDFEKAKQYYQKFTEIQPKEKNFNYYFRMGRAYIVLLNYENAIKYFKKALEFGEKEDIVNRYLEICHKETNHIEKKKDNRSH